MRVVIDIPEYEYTSIVEDHEKHSFILRKDNITPLPEGRLIDADKLKEEIDISPYNDYDDYLRTERLIDDAPTVETDIEVATKDAYEHGYTDGWKERFGEPDGRPKGEWIEHEKWGGVWYTCSNCHQDAPYEQGVYNNWIQKLSDFCPNCGAQMEM